MDKGDNQKNITQLNSDESVLLLVKRHNSKSIESAITMFIKEYFKCSHCTKLTKRFGKVLNTVYSICVICNDIKIKSVKNKTYKIFKKGFEADTLCYINNLKSIISDFFEE
jgi:translation initiation factor 2 beta subunit (eIF-2beta)/eIF-5